MPSARSRGRSEASPRSCEERDTCAPSLDRSRRRRSSPTGRGRWRASSSLPRSSSRSTRQPASWSPISSDVPAAVGEVISLREPVEEPHAVRRPHHRLDDREGDRRRRRAAARSRGHLQPPAGADAARDRRHDPLRPRHPRHEVADEGGVPANSPYNSRRHGIAAHPDNQPRSAVDEGSGDPATVPTSTTSASPAR